MLFWDQLSRRVWGKRVRGGGGGTHLGARGAGPRPLSQKRGDQHDEDDQGREGHQLETRAPAVLEYILNS